MKIASLSLPPGAMPGFFCLAPPAALPPTPLSVGPLSPADTQIMRDLTATYKDRPSSYLWAEGGAQPMLEANFGVGGK